MNTESQHTSTLRAPQSYLLERRIATLKHALAVRGGRIVSIDRPHANQAASYEQDWVASVTYAIDVNRAYNDQA